MLPPKLIFFKALLLVKQKNKMVMFSSQRMKSRNMIDDYRNKFLVVSVVGIGQKIFQR